MPVLHHTSRLARNAWTMGARCARSVPPIDVPRARTRRALGVTHRPLCLLLLAFFLLALLAALFTLLLAVLGHLGLVHFAALHAAAGYVAQADRARNRRDQRCQGG